MEDKPFHLIASDCQNSKKEDVLSLLQSHGFEKESPNFTITQFGGHETVKGNGFAPYYILFDHRGEIFYHYKAGKGHGGDGLKFLSLTEKLIEDTPLIYTGKKIYKHIGPLATQVAAKQQLSKAIGNIRERLIAAEESKEVLEELQRLYDAIKKYRDQRLKTIDKLLATAPDQILPALKALEADFKGTILADNVDAKVEELKNSKSLKTAIKIQKKFKFVQDKLSLLKPCDSCKKKGYKSFSDSCSSCQQINAPLIQKLLQQLEKEIEGEESLPISLTVKKFIQQLSPKNS